MTAESATAGAGQLGAGRFGNAALEKLHDMAHQPGGRRCRGLSVAQQPRRLAHMRLEGTRVAGPQCGGKEWRILASQATTLGARDRHVPCLGANARYFDKLGDFSHFRDVVKLLLTLLGACSQRLP